MRTFTVADLQRASAEIQKEAAKAPVFLTYHDKPRFVVMSIEDFVRLQGARIMVSPEAFPDSVMARIKELEDAHPDAVPDLAGGLADLLDDGTSISGPRP